MSKNPIAKALKNPSLQQRIVAASKGKGSYDRNIGKTDTRTETEEELRQKKHQACSDVFNR